MPWGLVPGYEWDDEQKITHIQCNQECFLVCTEKKKNTNKIYNIANTILLTQFQPSKFAYIMEIILVLQMHLGNWYALEKQ